MSNIQVTHDTDLNNARSESNIAINPRNPQEIVAGSKKFKDIKNYDFTLATAYSSDGGHTWNPSADIPKPGWDCLTDPALAWDDIGGVYLVALACNNPPSLNDTIGIAIYKSTDKGKTWSQPNLIHTNIYDDKQWAAGDGNPHSPFHGRIYAVWDGGSGMCFARTLDYGQNWIGTGSNPPGSVLANNSFAPEINVSIDGTVYIVWMAGTEIKMMVSTNGGDSFFPVSSPANGVSLLGSNLPIVDQTSPVFPGGTFRVATVPSACVYGQKVVVAWADYRETISRIYYALSNDGGSSWITGPSGQPLLPGTNAPNQQHFHPQIVSQPNGVIGCAFYEFGPKPTNLLIDVILVKSFDGGQTFSQQYTITDQAWDPTIDAPWAHGDKNITFIGDYFGLDASDLGFFPLWTDTRTGIQELWTYIETLRIPGIYEQVAVILAGIIQDGGGIENVGGHIKRIPPWGPPELDILLGIAIHRIAGLMSGQEGKVIQRDALKTVVKVAQQELRRMENKE